MKYETILKEYYRYIVAGIIVTGFDFCILIFLTEILGIHYLISASTAYIFAAILHYIISVKYVFNYNGKASPIIQFIIFFIIGIIGLVLLEILMYILAEKMHLYYVFAKAIATGIIFTFNFLSRKLILFKM